MIVEQGVVIATDAELAWVEMRRQRTCGGCKEQQGCGISAIDRWLGERATVLQARNAVGAAAGDRVAVGLGEGALLRGAGLVYITPILALLVMAGVVQLWAPAASEWPVVLAGALGFVVALFWVRRVAVGQGRRDDWQPVVVERLGRDGEGDEIPVRNQQTTVARLRFRR
ncbi:MAG: SoxR reducing system RseC family protein [Thiotrichales bacterium]